MRNFHVHANNANLYQPGINLDKLWSLVSEQTRYVLDNTYIALRYLPLGVLPSWSRSVCNITIMLSLEFASSNQTLGKCMEQISTTKIILF